MKPEALDAFATRTTRPQALEAATIKTLDINLEERQAATTDRKDSYILNEPENMPTKPTTPLGERTDGTGSAAKIVEDVVRGVKTAVQGVVAWTEKKADDLVSFEDGIGPYASPATCVVSDLDPIASGILPVAMPVQDENENNASGKTNDVQDGETNDKKEHRS